MRTNGCGPRGAWRAASDEQERERAVFWGVLALHQSATMSTNLDSSGKSIARDKPRVDCW